MARSIRVSSERDGETGSVILGISDRLVAAMVSPTQNQTRKAVQTSTVGKRSSLVWINYILILNEYQRKHTLIPIYLQDLSLRTMGPGSHDDISVVLSAKGQTMDINLQSLAEKNNGESDYIIKNMQ